MTDQRTTYWDENPTIEVRVYRHDALVDSALCESAAEAVLVLDGWSDVDDVRCEVIDLISGAPRHDLFEPGASGDLIDDLDEDYPHLE